MTITHFTKQIYMKVLISLNKCISTKESHIKEHLMMEDIGTLSSLCMGFWKVEKNQKKLCQQLNTWLKMQFNQMEESLTDWNSSTLLISMILLCYWCFMEKFKVLGSDLQIQVLNLVHKSGELLDGLKATRIVMVVSLLLIRTKMIISLKLSSLFSNWPELIKVLKFSILRVLISLVTCSKLLEIVPSLMKNLLERLSNICTIQLMMVCGQQDGESTTSMQLDPWFQVWQELVILWTRNGLSE